MPQFSVWIRPLGQTFCRIRVDSVGQAQWLLDRLSRSFVFKNCEPLREDRFTPGCTFQVSYDSRNNRNSFERLLRNIPEVHLMAEPA